MSSGCLARRIDSTESPGQSAGLPGPCCAWQWPGPEHGKPSETKIDPGRCISRSFSLPLENPVSKHGIKMVQAQNHASRIKKAAATIYGWDCPLLPFIYPGFACGSCLVACLLCFAWKNVTKAGSTGLKPTSREHRCIFVVYLERRHRASLQLLFTWKKRHPQAHLWVKKAFRNSGKSGSPQVSSPVKNVNPQAHLGAWVEVQPPGIALQVSVLVSICLGNPF